MVQKIPQRKDGFIWREMDGETFILSETGDKIITMNKVASYIWQQSDGKQSLNQILGKILEDFEIDRKQAENDLRQFIDEMLEKDMIVFR